MGAILGPSIVGRLIRESVASNCRTISSRISSAIGEIQFISAHLDSSNKPDCFKNSIAEVAQFFEATNRNIVIRIDAQTPLGPRVRDEDPWIIGPAVEDLNRTARAHSVAEIVQCFQLSVGQTFFQQQSGAFTWVDDHHQKPPETKDYILISSNLLNRLEDCQAHWTSAKPSDHRSVRTRIRLQNRKITPQTQIPQKTFPKPIGW